ncbi:maleylacetate reductase [Nitrospirillum viridazoti Y2]|uniref:Maleylacetate reductase n=1 Tax=Nitrospirillum amazonense TaxID=28077 RepID=A0A560HK08_9PROT|nr:maleylacetate reductase [Nitrospirillum amazonense]EGY02668.1 maleylacetate reductase [Nitrospirillum amazonense Y2]TWB46837.1 maleylacetate reductase [Nitrospirillum amazonense]
MTPFVYTANPVRVLFGSDLLKTALAEELTRIDAKKPMILTTPEQESDGRKLAQYLRGVECSVFPGARMHTPVDTTLRAMDEVGRRETDCLVALGGGSTIGLAKAIALRTDLHQIAIPTTYAGSEATPILGETENGVKTTQSSARILPEVILYDVDLTLSLPPALSVTSGINAIAHAVEGLYSQQSNPIISLIAEEGIRALTSGLPRIVADPSDTEARSNALYGAWLCGTTLGAVGMAIHHKLCHALGGAFDLPHSQTHTVILPHALAYNAPYVIDALNRIERAIGTENAPLALYNLAKSLGAPTSLKELGMPREGLDRIVELTFKKQYWNPAPLEEARLRGLLLRAWEGAPPGTD